MKLLSLRAIQLLMIGAMLILTSKAGHSQPSSCQQLTEFADGTTASADEVNCNFQLLSGRILVNDNDIGSVNLDITRLRSANVLRVALDGAPFSKVSDAMASVVDASEANPYLIVIGPGNYTTTDVTLKSHVYIRGSGEKTTTLSCNGCDSIFRWLESSPLRGRLSDLSIINEGGVQALKVVNFGDSCIYEVQRASIAVLLGKGTPTAAILANNCSLEIDKTTISSSSTGAAAYGIYTTDGISLSITDSVVSAYKGEPSAGVIALGTNRVNIKDTDVDINGGNSAAMIDEAYGISVSGKETGRAGYYFEGVNVNVTARTPTAVRAINGANVKIANSKLYARKLDEKAGLSIALAIEGTETLGGSAFQSEARVATSEILGLRRCLTGCARICVVHTYTDSFTPINDGCVSGP